MIRVAATLAIAVVLTGCSPSVDSLSIHRFTADRENAFPPFDRAVTDAASASRLYQDIRSLRPQPEGTYFCGLDFGIRYELSFFARGDRVLQFGALDLYTRGADLWPTPIPRP